MSTQRFLPKMRKGMGRSVVSPLSLLVGVLLLWQLALPSVALASHAASTPTPGTNATSTPPPSSTATAPSSASSPPQTVPPDGAQTLAEVSVVRLVATYTGLSDQGPKPSFISCTGLGVIIGSWPFSSSSLTTTTWVLTDASLVNPAKAGCAAAAKLGSIQVYANSFSTGPLAASTLPTAALIGTLPCATVCSVLQLATSSACSIQCAGPVVFSFIPNHPQPFVTPAQNDLTPHLALALTDNQQQSPPATKNVPVQNYLTPTAVSPLASSSTATPGASTQPELGLPTINKEGQLVTMHLSSGSLDLTKLSAFITNKTGTASHSNALNAAWTQGMSSFYGLNGQPKDLNAAATEFQAAHTANPDFQAAAFMQQAAVKAAGSSQRTSPPTTSSSSSAFFGIPLWILAILALVVLLAIFVLVSLSFGRKRAQQRQELAHFKADQAEAQRMAEIEVERQRQTSALGNRSIPSNQQAQVGSDLHCPVCNYPVSTNEAYCSNCHTLLSPSASGLHLVPKQPAQPLQPPQQQSPDVTWSGNYPPTPPQMSPQQAAFVQQPSTLVPASSISDQPTIEMSPDTSNGQFDAEKTVPYAVQQVFGRNLSLAVGYRTDPGIKRKHKPNEDSLFAMQGARTHNSQPQEFGLFVVADGMGGHANGQDASRLAIQTIIDYILPKVTASNNMDDAAFLKLLSDGVQCANEAVHRRNLEERADMGTTMTATLVAGSTAYVSNVGDSRTYLYREPDGLQKITRDHSVVASLVDAGIIQPDDIYTHPKRNQIYRSLGEKPVVEVDSFQIPLQAGDKLLLCSDGLWDMVRDPEIQRVMSNPAPDPTMTGNALIKAALDSGGEDNVSVIVVSITETSNRTGMTGVQLLAKPDSVTVPEIPSL